MLYGLPTIEDLVAQVRTDHAGRPYHNFDGHIEDCLAKLAIVEDLSPAHRRILTYAFIWHDCVYDPKRQDNEELSADRARLDLTSIGADPDEIEEVASLILLTAGHRVDEGDLLGEIMISIDLSILGSDPATYHAYADAIRLEYAHVPDEDYRAGRRAVLQRFLETEHIFPHSQFRSLYETQARANIASEIAQLSQQASNIEDIA